MSCLFAPLYNCTIRPPDILRSSFFIVFKEVVSSLSFSFLSRFFSPIFILGARGIPANSYNLCRSSGDNCSHNFLFFSLFFKPPLLKKKKSYGHMGLEKIALMHSLLPSLKLIALVREPTARAYSGFQHTCMKGRVFHVNTDLGMSSKSEARNLLRRELAGRIVIAENKTQAVEGLYLRFGRFAIFEVHLRQLEYPCPPSAFDDFLMLPNAVSDQQSPQRSASIPIQPHLNEEVQESLLDVREDKVGGTSLSSILSHGLYAKAISEFQTLYRPEQLLTVFTEEMQSDLLQTLDKVMAFLGIPQFDYKPFAHRNAPGGVVATFQRSKTATSSYLPMSQRARQVLEAFYAQPNLDLAKLLGDNRVESLWTR